MRILLSATILLSAIALGGAAAGAGELSVAGFRACAAEADGAARLACYDALARNLESDTITAIPDGPYRRTCVERNLSAEGMLSALCRRLKSHETPNKTYLKTSCRPDEQLVNHVGELKCVPRKADPKDGPLPQGCEGFYVVEATLYATCLNQNEEWNLTKISRPSGRACAANTALGNVDGQLKCIPRAP